jgi:hypothetical protein
MLQTNCKASITLKYHLDGQKVDVDYQWQHTGHNPYSRDGLGNSKIPRGLRLWVKDLAEKGLSATQMAAIVRLTTRSAYQVRRSQQKPKGINCADCCSLRPSTQTMAFILFRVFYPTNVSMRSWQPFPDILTAVEGTGGSP